MEESVLGLYLSGHPMSLYRQDARQLRCQQIKDIDGIESVRIAGMVTQVSRPNERTTIVTLEDETAAIEIAVFLAKHQEMREKLRKDEFLVAEGTVAKK